MRPPHPWDRMKGAGWGIARGCQCGQEVGLPLGWRYLTVLPDISDLAALPCSKVASLSWNEVCLQHHARVVAQGCAPRTACLRAGGMAGGKELAQPSADTTALTQAATRAEMWLQSTQRQCQRPESRCQNWLCQKMGSWAKLLACEKCLFAKGKTEWRGGCKK